MLSIVVVFFILKPGHIPSAHVLQNEVLQNLAVQLPENVDFNVGALTGETPATV
jgi:hypothetical protein